VALFEKKNILYQYKPEVIKDLYAKSGIKNLYDLLPNILIDDMDLYSHMRDLRAVGSAFIVVKKGNNHCALWKERRVFQGAKFKSPWRWK